MIITYLLALRCHQNVTGRSDGLAVGGYMPRPDERASHGSCSGGRSKRRGSSLWFSCKHSHVRLLSRCSSHSALVCFLPSFCLAICFLNLIPLDNAHHTTPPDIPHGCESASCASCVCYFIHADACLSNHLLNPAHTARPTFPMALLPSNPAPSPERRHFSLTKVAWSRPVAPECSVSPMCEVSRQHS
jgi:hypothetical protein